jgi:hypothetical protein
VKETSSKSGFAPNAFEIFCALMIGGKGDVLPTLSRLSRNLNECRTPPNLPMILQRC